MRKSKPRSTSSTFGELSVGLAATIAPLTGEKKDYPARVILIGRRVSESCGAIPIRLAFAGTTPRLPVGLSVDVNLEIAAHPASITVPRESVGGLGERPFVIVVKNGTTLHQDVDVIDWPSARIVVRRGVAAGDTIAVLPRTVPAGIVVRTRVAPDAF